MYGTHPLQLSPAGTESPTATTDRPDPAEVAAGPGVDAPVDTGARSTEPETVPMRITRTVTTTIKLVNLPGRCVTGRMSTLSPTPVAAMLRH
jgi:hypothetical protein